ncbi:histone H1.2-like [Belonocnema kinseyi]|uniref:histone H1.2-like n=1 Tax=Belonocnema kinseyi TaxID=2817044 RepID=UPI00143CFA27|nr:histone H1.2-like [Belonocnema kinseyi]
MSETQAVALPAVQATPKKSVTSTKGKKPATKSSHPRTSEMVTAAISALRERGGSSIQAIKKYIVGTYMLDAEKQAPFIKKYLKTAVEQGQVIQTKGKGVSGSFKLAKSSAAKPKAAAKTKSAAQKPMSLKKPLKTVRKVDMAKKTAVARKSPVKKPTTKKLVSKKTSGPALKKIPAKAKKTAKSPTAKPKAPKSKTKAAK